ncbi:MAG: hypothetical protein ABIL70_05050 [candidate division WOR-3 bacterium]
MKILFYFPVSAPRRYEPLTAIKGSAFFRRPNYDAMRLSYLSQGHEFYYYDERIEPKPEFLPDVLVVNTPLNLAHYVASTINKEWNRSIRTIGYGIYPTLYPNEAKKIFNVVVRGDIVPLWPTILDDLTKGKTPSVYESNLPLSQFNLNRDAENRYGFTPLISQLRTQFGCQCAKKFKDYCYESIYYNSIHRWEPKEVAREVLKITRKVIYIMDDDFLDDIDYAMEILDRCWYYKKMWIFQTKGTIFRNPKLFPKIRENGVRIIYLKEDWLGDELTKKIYEKEFVKEKEHEVSMVHGHRIAMGAKILLGFEGENQQFYRDLIKFLVKLKLDFIEVSAQTPLPFTETYNRYERNERILKYLSLYDRWMPVVKLDYVNQNDLYSWMELLRDSFYSWDSIIRRMMFAIQKFGIYNTLFFYLIPNLSYRENFLEKVGYPP